MEDHEAPAFPSPEADVDSCDAGTVHPDQAAFIHRLWTQGVSVIPIPYGTKIPNRQWKRFQKELPTIEDLSGWFFPRWGLAAPRTNYAILTGDLSDLVAVDADSEAAEAWAAANLPPTPWMTRTRQGRHRYYRHPPGVRIGNRVKLRTGVDQLDLDIRGDGGYCIGPYSVHESGSVYQLDGDWNAPKSDLPVFDPCWLPEDPHVTSVPDLPSQPIAPTRQLVPLSAPLSDADAFVRAEAYVYAMGPAVEGSGGDLHTYRVAATLVNDWALSDADALIIMSRWNAHCQPQWPQEHLIAKLRSARRSGKHIVGRLREFAFADASECTAADYILIGQAHELLAAQERASSNPTEATRPLTPIPAEPIIRPWDSQPSIDSEQPRRDYCGRTRIQITGGDKGFTRVPWICGQWRCGHCQKRQVSTWLTHMADQLQGHTATLYVATAPHERTLAGNISRQFERAHAKGIDVQYLRITRSDVVDAARLSRMTYLSTWAPMEQSTRGRKSAMPGIQWEEVSPVEAHAWLRDVALRLPGVSRAEAGTPGRGQLPRWRIPERERTQSGRRAVMGSDKRLDAALYEAKSRVFDQCLQAGVLPPDIVIGEAINDVTARHLFEANWVNLAQSSTRLGADEYEW